MSEADRRLYEPKPDDGRTRKEKLSDFFGKFRKKEHKEKKTNGKKK